MIIRNPAVVEEAVQCLTDRVTAPAVVRILDRHRSWLELSLGLWPWLVIP